MGHVDQKRKQTKLPATMGAQSFFFSEYARWKRDMDGQVSSLPLSTGLWVRGGVKEREGVQLLGVREL